LLLFCMGGMFLVIGRAPGWERSRLSTLIAFSAALYAAVDIVFSLRGLNPEVIRLTGVVNFFLAAVHCSAWVVYAFAAPTRPFATLARSLRVVVIVTLALGLLALLPGVATTDQIRTIEVQRLGVVYRQFATTPYADGLSLWLLLVLCLPFAKFWAAYRRGERDAGVRVLGFAVFFACGIVEVLVTNGVISFLYLGDLGFLAMVLTLLTESLRRVMRDARELEALGRDLARQVDSRTQERDEARDALVHAERQAALGRLAAGVGHEINNPLTYIRGNLEYLEQHLQGGAIPSDSVEVLHDALVGTKQIQRVVADLRSYALPASEKRELIELKDVLEAAVKLTAPELRHVAQIQLQLPPVRPVLADAVRLSQVFVNLLLNAAHAIKDAKRSEPLIRVRAHENERGELVVAVEDNGVGVAPAALARLGEPYFSSRADRGGTGLGLFVARGIVSAFGGSLVFHSELGQGTTATLTMPSADSVSARLTPPSALEQLATRSSRPELGALRRRVLLVDDDPAVARAISRLLVDMDVSVAKGGKEALQQLALGTDLDAVLCDVMMPGVSGPDVYEAVAATWPALLPKLIFLTGGTTVPEVAAFLGRPGVRHLSKPFDREAFEALLG
jgi:signal transduction histidine kinase